MITKKDKNIFIIARFIAIIFLIWAYDNHPYGYYTFLRFLVCGICVYGAYYSKKNQKSEWVWVMASIAVLFNPLIPIHLPRDTWKLIDGTIATILLLSIYFIDRPMKNLNKNK